MHISLLQGKHGEAFVPSDLIDVDSSDSENEILRRFRKPKKKINDIQIIEHSGYGEVYSPKFSMHKMPDQEALQSDSKTVTQFSQNKNHPQSQQSDSFDVR
jgi:hypothetical protein